VEKEKKIREDFVRCTLVIVRGYYGVTISIGFLEIISMGLLLDFYGIPIAFLWNFHDVSMIFL